LLPNLRGKYGKSPTAIEAAIYIADRQRIPTAISYLPQGALADPTCRTWQRVGDRRQDGSYLVNAGGG
jgi:hypothetical protein